MNHPTPLLRYCDEDRELLTVHELSKKAQVAQAFINLAISLGCPISEAKLSQSMLLEWLFPNYGKVREAAGLKPLQPIDDVQGPAFVRLMMGNAMITLLDFSESRSTSRLAKRQIRQVRRLVERTLDRQ